MPNAPGIGLLGPLQVRDETGRPVHVGGRQLRVLLTLLALNAGRVVPVGSLAGQLWPEDPPGNPGNALQTLVSRLRAGLRQAGAGEEAAVRDAFAEYYLDLAETADPGLRAAGQRRWLRELTVEQDNLHAGRSAACLAGWTGRNPTAGTPWRRSAPSARRGGRPPC